MVQALKFANAGVRIGVKLNGNMHELETQQKMKASIAGSSIMVLTT
jgi:hypothetical protein